MSDAYMKQAEVRNDDKGSCVCQTSQKLTVRIFSEDDKNVQTPHRAERFNESAGVGLKRAASLGQQLMLPGR